MSSEHSNTSINGAGLAPIREVLRNTGSGCDEPMAEADRESARSLTVQSHQGVPSAEDLKFALTHKAEMTVMAHGYPSDRRASS